MNPYAYHVSRVGTPDFKHKRLANFANLVPINHYKANLPASIVKQESTVATVAT